MTTNSFPLTKRIIHTMKRRNFVQGMLAFSMFPLNSILKYSLVSTADIDTKSNEELAKKARTLAEYIITKDDHPKLSYYEEKSTEKMQTAYVEIDLNGYEYRVKVENYNEKQHTQELDTLFFWKRPKNTFRKSTLTAFTDRGLDGRCDSGTIPYGISASGEREVYRAKEEGYPGSGTQYQKQFQNLYEKTLDALISFYENE